MRIKILTGTNCEDLTREVNEFIEDIEHEFHIRDIRLTETNDQWSVLIIFDPL